MYEPYTSTHTIRVSVKKRQQLPPDTGPVFMTHIPALTPPKRVTVKNRHQLPPNLGPVCMTHIPALTPS